ncbi:MAG TPA: YibE/F family protein [Candidatus Cryosericum sp.]|nr:YibE/F family protein [Candidatus Cryosericum sp.]
MKNPTDTATTGIPAETAAEQTDSLKNQNKPLSFVMQPPPDQARGRKPWISGAKEPLDREHVKRTWIATVLCLLFIIVLILLPTGYEHAGAAYRDGSDRIRARVTQVDNGAIVDNGLVRTGDQRCTVTLLVGEHKGESFVADNILNGSLEQDKIYKSGDTALVLVSYQQSEVYSVSMIDHYRIDGELLLLGGFIALMLLFAGWTGLRAVLSFLLAVLSIWKVLVPCCLNGLNPILIGGLITVVLTVMTIGLVFGFDRRCLSACVGAITGLAVTCALGILCTNAFKIHGAVMSFSESLLYSGFSYLNLTQIFMASIFIGSSGAMMDLSVDIAASVHEVVQKRPDISRIEAIWSGIHVGRAAMGTQITTLLLAYSGSYIALLMVFMAQGTPLINVFNYKYVASEIIHTLVGSFGLVAAAPLTAVASGLFLAKKEHPKKTVLSETAAE